MKSEPLFPLPPGLWFGIGVEQEVSVGRKSCGVARDTYR